MEHVKILLWEIRFCLKITTRELSDLSGVSISEINKIENHKVSPTIDTLFKLSTALNVQIEDFYTIIDED
jgi:transcriptional regulator with XRE-family HTH domain